ncbi:MAG TPA: hypothetical protein VHB79_35710 [Polyangiaceae bacterium]|nr:hypothetical protein [Polyangiaceae bacterium]
MTTKAETHTRSVREGLAGAFGALFNLGTPFLRNARNRWGLALEETQRAYPGDELVPKPTWMWTHAVDIDIPAAGVWPWLVQIGQDKAGFYSYQWLENLAGCQIRNASSIEAAWQTLKVGDALKLHPKVPPLTVAAIQAGKWFVVTSETDAELAPGAEAEAHVSWLFLLEPLGPHRCRLISRFRVDHVRGWRARLSYGPWLTESIGFVMDRAMLRGIKRRAEGRQ